MTTIGEIKKVTGSLNADSATIVQEKGIVYLEVNSIWNPVRINLSKNLARVESGSETHTSAGKVLARTALAGMAGSAWQKGSGGWSGVLGGLASSFGTTSERGYVVITLMDGNSLGGYTTDTVINFLTNGSPSLSDEEIVELRKKREKLDRYIEDSARTHLEVLGHIEELKITAEKYKNLSENGESFDERDEARELYFEANNELAEQQALYKLLDDRNKQIKAFGTVEKYQEKSDQLSKQLLKAQRKTGIPYIALTVVGLLIWWLMMNDSADTRTMIILYLVIFSIYPAIRLSKLSGNRSKARLLEEQLQDIQNL